MNNKTASEILKSLAMGQQPESGEDIENIDVLSDPNIIRALVMGSDALHSAKKRNLPEGAGKPWTQDEDDQLALEFHSNISISELAKLHRRTAGAISARLVKIGLMQDRYFDPRNLESNEQTSEGLEEEPGVEEDPSAGEGLTSIPNSSKPTKEEINEVRDRMNQKNGWPARHNYPWEEKDLKKIRELFEMNLPLVEIAVKMQRSPRSISLKLEKIGLVSVIESESLQNFYKKHEEIEKEGVSRSERHDAATIADIIGRDPEAKIEDHYEVSSAADSAIGGTREDTRKLRARNYSEIINRNY